MVFNINPAGGGDGIQTVKLKEVTTTAAAARVEFDLSDIDLDRYQELKFCMELLPASAVNFVVEVQAWFNAVGAKTDPENSMQFVPFGGTRSTDYLYGATNNTSGTLFPTYWTIRANVSVEHSSLSESKGRYYLSGDSHCEVRGPQGHFGGVGSYSGNYGAILSELNKLIIAIQNLDSTNHSFAAGSKLTVYGVLR